MERSGTSRRRFIGSVAAATAGLSLRPTARSYARILGANDRVRVGIVGFSDRTRSSLIPALLAHADELGFEITAVSDLWSVRRERALVFLQEKTGRAVALCRNNDELYERNDVDAVIIGTADFQHALHCVEAVAAGRDAYVEKPLADTMEDARAVLRAVERSDRIVQVGTQRRSGRNYQRANEFVRSGRFGPMVAVEMTWNVNQPGRWRRPAEVALLKEADTDWKRFLINRPFEPFEARKYLEFRLFWPYSSGIPDQWMVHQIDTVHWFTGLAHPRSVVANGGIYLWNDGRRNFDTMTAVFDYGPIDQSRGFQVVYSSRMTNSAGGVKEIYRSNGGTLDMDRNRVSGEGGLEEGYAQDMGMEANQLSELSLDEAAAVETAADTGVDVLTSAHVRNWMECVRTRSQPNAPIRAGYQHSLALCMVIAALQTGRRVTFDEASQDVVVS
jgi:predicted dehydrogenase